MNYSELKTQQKSKYAELLFNQSKPLEGEAAEAIFAFCNISPEGDNFPNTVRYTEQFPSIKNPNHHFKAFLFAMRDGDNNFNGIHVQSLPELRPMNLGFNVAGCTSLFGKASEHIAITEDPFDAMRVNFTHKIATYSLFSCSFLHRWHVPHFVKAIDFYEGFERSNEASVMRKNAIARWSAQGIEVKSYDVPY